MMKSMRFAIIFFSAIFSACSLSPVYVSVPLVATVSTQPDVIDYFGSQPYEYSWGNEHYTATTLPNGVYNMSYDSAGGGYFDLVINNSAGQQLLVETRITTQEYRCLEGLTVDLTKEEVFALVGDPAETRTGVANTYDPDVFFQDINGVAGYCYYDNSAHQVRMFFSGNKTNAVYIYGPDESLERWQ
jgi:hypothetical protein